MGLLFFVTSAILATDDFDNIRLPFVEYSVDNAASFFWNT